MLETAENREAAPSAFVSVIKQIEPAANWSAGSRATTSVSLLRTMGASASPVMPSGVRQVIVTDPPSATLNCSPKMRASWGPLPSREAGSTPSMTGGSPAVTVSAASSTPTVASGFTTMTS
ncbi:MAG: hypothetical protein R3F43_15405 [bacterium]